jgi:hypothetical protein
MMPINKSILLLLGANRIAAQSDGFVANPSPNNHILAEEYINNLDWQVKTISVRSDVPVQIQRYSDQTESFLEGQAPVSSNQVMVVVTSDCATTDTSLVPTIKFSADAGDINVLVGVSEEEGATMGFLESSYYEAFWSYVSGWCGAFSSSTTQATEVIPPETKAPTTTSTEATFITQDGSTETTPATAITGFPPGDQLMNYTACDFNCCSNNDCAVMIDEFTGSKSVGCCIEGKCEASINPFDGCAEPPIGPPADMLCGYDAWKKFEADGNCPSDTNVTSSTSSTTFTTTSSEVSTTSSSSTPDLIIDGNTTVDAICEPGECLDPNGTCAVEVQCFADPCDVPSSPCGADESCEANYCGGCNAVCFSSTPPTGNDTNLVDPTIPQDTTSVATSTSTGSTISATDSVSTPAPKPAVPETTVASSTIASSTSQGMNTTSTTAQTTDTIETKPPVSSPGTTSTSSTSAATTQAADTTTYPILASNAPSPASSMSYSPTLNSTSNATFGTTTAPTSWWDNNVARSENANSAIIYSSGFASGRSFAFRIATTLIVLLLVTIVIPGRDGGNLFGFGKVVVAAMAVSSLYSRSTKKGNIRRTAMDVPRVLQDTCTYNVEILIDSCSHPVEITAPSARAIDVVLEDFASENNADDKCQTDYSANLTFPVAETTFEMDLTVNNTLDKYEDFDWMCLRAIEGRPFIDASGKGLQAMPLVADSCLGIGSISWSGEVSLESATSYSINNSTIQYLALGEEWTQRALGEHSSIASFSAFSIALMTNRAPSNLVEDALNAGLDEVRHARTSFEIASKLIGRNVEPGALPESRHEFGQDLTALALGVAREGCVDETLSAFAAAIQVEDINNFFENDVSGSKYSNVDRETLVWIRDEMKTIAMEESNHSSLAWRTLQWACNVDSVACEVVQKEVFDESQLEKRFHQRAETAFIGRPEVLYFMKREWNKIYNAHKLLVEDALLGGSICTETVKDDGSTSLLSSVTENVLRGVVLYN